MTWVYGVCSTNSTLMMQWNSLCWRYRDSLVWATPFWPLLGNIKLIIKWFSSIVQLRIPLIGLSFQRLNMRRMELIPSINSMATCRIHKHWIPKAFSSINLNLNQPEIMSLLKFAFNYREKLWYWWCSWYWWCGLTVLSKRYNMGRSSSCFEAFRNTYSFSSFPDSSWNPYILCISSWQISSYFKSAVIRLSPPLAE